MNHKRKGLQKILLSFLFFWHIVKFMVEIKHFIDEI